MTWPSATLSEIAEIVSGATPKTDVAEYWDGEIPWATPKDLSSLTEAHISSTPRSITKAGLRSCAATVLPPDSVLLSSRAPIGHVAINSVAMATNQGFKSLVPKRQLVDPKYLYHWLRANRSYLNSLGNGATFKEISKATVSRVAIPLPSLNEQRRIAAILDHADLLLGKVNRVHSELEGFTSRTFDLLFGEHASTGHSLTDIANVSSGITKGRRLKTDATLREVPYLAVSNVKDRYLDLRSVKTMNVTEEEQLRFALAPGDLLLTEGGDPDKLGRGTLWRGELAEALHQNHIFRVRLHEDSPVTPTYLSWYTASRTARSYFLSCAKQTTGIASINKTQLGALPVVVPGRDAQLKFERLERAVSDQRTRAAKAVGAYESLFASLQARAFSGQL